jgi:hypothetical protein
MDLTGGAVGGEVAAPWTQVGSDGSDEAKADWEDLYRQLQCGDDEELAARVLQKTRLRTQGVAKARAKAKAKADTGSATGQPAQATPRATAWDAKASARHRGVPSEDDVQFPPLPAKDAGRAAPGTPAKASVTGSLTEPPSAVGASSPGASTGSAPPVQGTGSFTVPPSVGASAAGAPPVLPAEGQENGRGMGLRGERSVQESVMGVGGPSPQEPSDQVMRREGPVPDLVLLTLNINSWSPFRDRWSAEGAPPEYSAVIAGAQAHDDRAL